MPLFECCCFWRETNNNLPETPQIKTSTLTKLIDYNSFVFRTRLANKIECLGSYVLLDNISINPQMSLSNCLKNEISFT